MRLLVIGGPNGQVAGALRALDRPDFCVTALGRPQADLSKPETLANALAVTMPDVVVCAGAFTAVDLAESQPENAHRINAEGAGALAALCAGRGVPLIHLSTDYVFDGAKETPYAETDAPDPTGAYGRSKLAGERAVAAAGGAYVIVRTAWVYAATGKNFVRTMLRLAKTHERIGVVDDQRGCPSYAGHIAEAVARIAQGLVQQPGDAAGYGVFHVTGAGICTWRGFAEAIFEGARARGGPHAAVEPLTTAQYPTPAHRPANSALACDKLAGVYGVRLPPWRAGLEQCLDLIAADGWRVE
jgi:dTDP-4-dehydrorhamnose reductase